MPASSDPDPAPAPDKPPPVPAFGADQAATLDTYWAAMRGVTRPALADAASERRAA